MKKSIIYLTTALSLCACAPSREELAKQYQAEVTYTGELQNQDYEIVARKLIEDALQNELERPKAGGGRYVLAIKDVKNNTMQRISPNEILSKLRIALQRSGKMYVVNLKDAARENRDAQDLANLSYVNKATVTKVDMVSYDVVMDGSISQKDVKLKGGNYLVEYVFNFILKDPHSMLTIWEGDIPVKKIVSADMINW